MQRLTVNGEILDGGDSQAIHAGAAPKRGRVLCGPIPDRDFSFPRTKSERVHAEDACGAGGAGNGPGRIWTGKVGRYVVGNGTWL